jgi:integrase
MTEQKLVRSITSGGTIGGSLSPAAIRQIVQKHGTKIGIPDLNPHDLRRTYAQLARRGGAPLETVQHSLGHASLVTTERYMRTGEECNAGDYIDIKLGEK